MLTAPAAWPAPSRGTHTHPSVAGGARRDRCVQTDCTQRAAGTAGRGELSVVAAAGLDGGISRGREGPGRDCEGLGRNQEGLGRNLEGLGGLNRTKPRPVQSSHGCFRLSVVQSYWDGNLID